MSGRLAGLRCLVVGGGSGIGLAVATRYHRDGAAVTVLDASAERCAELTAAGLAGLTAVHGDATDPADVEAALTVAERGGTLGHLTCCAGIHDQRAALRDLAPRQLVEGFTQLYAVNVLSVLVAVRVCLESLDRTRGSVTVTSSESAYSSRGGGVLYSSSKWALRGVVERLAGELAPAVRVNAVAPGGTGGTRLAGVSGLGQRGTAADSPGRDERIAAANPLGVVVTPEELADWYALLADPVAGRAVTGAVINVDGGR